MTTTQTSTTTATAVPAHHRAGGAASRLLGAMLCVAVTVIHLIDQGGLALKDPAYVGYGYWALEVAALAAAALLVARRLAGWLLALGVAAGPFAGYLLSRGPGLPGYSDDKGNWAEPLGLTALVVEVILMGLALTRLVNARRSQSV